MVRCHGADDGDGDGTTRELRRCLTMPAIANELKMEVVGTGVQACT
jgi:hypothetical protein